ncbi:HEAT repeat domain-containing protein [Halorubrum vacuolatum]|uniref:HEAT repeat-containing protein n=1 Tax=Halorubrum vacuolatum TaxID=63740 RepID=A0A238XD02_HALVU|nr:HEAT repeat domain-containing protein [Halorubrum vacuolatum]SNR56896.1 HEAT repeat-containing protein [Halorubrum vacuolatum]
MSDEDDDEDDGERTLEDALEHMRENAGKAPSDAPEENNESRSTLDRVRDAKRAASPDTGYRLAEWDMLKPPAERIGQTSRWWLRLSDVSIPPSSEFTDWSVFDRYTNDYVSRDFQNLPEEPDPESVSEAVSTIEDGDTKDVRIELVRIRRIAEQSPGACEPAIPTLVNILPSADIAVQAEILGIFQELADEEPELVSPVIDSLGGFLTAEIDDRLRKDAITILNTIAENDSSVVTDVVPKLEVLLKDKTNETGAILRLLSRVAKAHPEAILPIVPTLIDQVTDVSRDHRVGALAVLGHVSKAYPNVATEVIPTAHELLSADNDRLRANAAGLLADLAGEYPEHVQPAVPDAIELLSDEDDYARYNATSILARVANENPEPVEPATAALIDALNVDRPEARENACWALGYLRATTAEQALTSLAESDPNERVRHVASQALDEIRGS